MKNKLIRIRKLIELAGMESSLSDIIDIINEKENNDQNKEIESAYIRLWNAVENGTLKDDFFSLREDYRNTVQSDNNSNENQTDVIEVPEQKEKLVKVHISHHYICKKSRIDEAKEALLQDLSGEHTFDNIKAIEAPEACEDDIPDFLRDEEDEEE